MNPDPSTRDKILDSGVIVFAERGFQATTVADVAKHAGLTTGSVYSNFEGKRDLFLGCVEQCLGATFPTLQTDYSAFDPDEVIERITDASVRFVMLAGSDPVYFRLMTWAMLLESRDSDVARVLDSYRVKLMLPLEHTLSRAGALMVGSLVMGLGLNMLRDQSVTEPEIRRILSGVIRAARTVTLAEAEGAGSATIEVLP